MVEYKNKGNYEKKNISDLCKLFFLGCFYLSIYALMLCNDVYSIFIKFENGYDNFIVKVYRYNFKFLFCGVK